jgi:drug/metabolite transporter (DMT)-like permease
MFAASLWAGQSIPPRRWLGAGIAFVGLAWLLWPTGSTAPALVGSVLMVLAAIGWGIYSVLGKGGRDPLATTAGSFVLALGPAMLVLLLLPDKISMAGAGLAIISGAVTSGLGYALWYQVLPRLDTSVAAVLQLTVPVLAMAAGVGLLGEALTLRFAVATALVLGGVAVAVIAPSAPATPR